MASELQLLTVGERTDPEWELAAVDLLDHLEARWSRFLPDSDVSRLNIAAGRPVRVDPTTVTLLTTMTDAWHATEQRFDPTTLRALVAAGYRSSIDDARRLTILPSGVAHLPADDVDAQRNGEPTLDLIEIDNDACTVRLPTGLAVDAGGIGKGLAADMTVALLLGSGADGALVSIGGDIAIGGVPPDEGWRVGVEHPERQSGTLGNISLTAGGVATSSTRSRRWRQSGSERHHVIDPWTGEPSTTDLASVTVIAGSGWLAEAHATAALLAGSHEVIEYLDRHELSGLAATGDHRVLTTDDLGELRGEHTAAPMMGVAG